MAKKCSPLPWNYSGHAAASHGLSPGASTSTANSKKCGNVTISWKQGSIVTEQVSVLVGSSIGKLFEIFLKVGGPKFLKQAIKPGDYMRVINETGNLPCDHVILVSCCNWAGDNGEAEKNLRFIVRACLQQALKFNAASIAFPIGTGGLIRFPYDKAKASQIMISEVINVARQLEKASLKDICFVVFDQDKKLVDAFDQEFTKAFDHTRGTSSHEESGSGIDPRCFWEGFHARLGRKYYGRTPPSTTNNALGVLVEVVIGDLTKEETDAIVNINAKDMNMQNAGQVSKAIAAAAGPDVQAECTKRGQQDAGSAVVTGAGKLKAKNIIHMIPGEGSVQHIQQCIEKCLQTADNSKFKSISMPACGTGGFKLSAGDSAQATFQALLKVRSNFKHLKKVRIVLFNSELSHEFLKKLDEYKSRIPNDTFGNSGKSKTVDGPKTTSIKLKVYGESKEVVGEAVADLSRAMAEACKTKTIKDENISKLSEDQRKVLKEKASDLDVEIKFDDSNQCIEFRGNPEDIMEIQHQSLKEIQKVLQDKVIPLPKEWCPMPKKNGKEETVHLVSLSKSSPEYKEVLKLFQDTGGTGQLLKIERIQNPHLYRQYIIRKEKVDKDNGRMKNERQLFHGTAAGNVNGINTSGFNRIFRGFHGTLYGEGVYFAKKASYSYTYTSPDANKNRHMYVARVLVGRYVLGNLQMKVPPKDPKTGTPFDSTADKNGSDASIFVAFYDAQCYPQYLITFQ